MSPRRHFLQYHLLPLAAYTALALIVLYPASLHPAALIPGAGDAPRHVWGLWWFEHALVGLGRSPLTTGLIYFPITPLFPHLGLLGASYLPAKFKLRFLEPVPTAGLDPEDKGLVQELADEIRGRIQSELVDVLAKRRSVWLG